jgi:hypothetical protein
LLGPRSIVGRVAARTRDEVSRKIKKAFDVGEIGDQSERHADGPRTLAVDAQSKIIDGQLGLVFGLTKTGIQLRSTDFERNLTTAGVAETARPQRDICSICVLLDQAVIERASVGIIEVEGDRPTPSIR